MTGFGRAILVLALLASVYAALAALRGAGGGRRRWVVSARHAVYALAALLTLAVIVLEAAYLRSDFSFGLVVDNSSTTTPTFYKLTAMWSSQAGSLLLWVWLLSIFSGLALAATRNRHREIVPYATAVLAGIATFFVALLVIRVSPFVHVASPPAEGAGLNPLLRHPSMMFHPPMLYSGYVAFSIPFAFAIGALVTRRLDAEWIRSTRRFALIAWAFLAIGILLGARWSYSELGWGGYWGWDPVENASLMPWLVGTAFLHSIMVQERRGMLKVWNVSLIIATFTLALLGTFLVRSGVLDSIHAFGASTVGGWFLGLIAIVLAGSTALIVTRLDALRSERRIDSPASREAVFLINNLLLVGLCFVVFWGTFFPLISEAVTGTRSSVGPPWFDRYTVPLAIALVLMAGIGPLLAWRRVTATQLRRVFAAPLAIAGVTLVALAALTDAASSPPSLALFGFAAFTIAAVGLEYVRAVRARRLVASEPLPAALDSVVRRNRRRYGGYLVHVGVAIALLGVAASSAFNTQRDVRLGPGEAATVAGYDLRYVRPTSDLSNERIAFGAVLDVRRDGERVATLTPSRNYFPAGDESMGPLGRFFRGESTSEVGLDGGLTRDVWTAMQPDLRVLNRAIREGNRLARDLPPEAQAVMIAALSERYVRRAPPATFRLIVNPMVTWIWIGGLIVLAGALITLWPSPLTARRRVTSLRAARIGSEPSRA
ncbi:MAG: heme lyase CcmF/NrfE family subunit [Solirubrobacterales bacterium]